MFAVVETGGKQYKVAPGDQLDVERLEVEVGQQFDLGRVLMISTDGGEVMVGTPVVEGARVVATVVTEHRGDKIIVFKYKPKKRYRRTMGHRQTLTRVSIDSIIADGVEANSKAQTSTATPKAKTTKVKATPAAQAEQTIITATPAAEVSGASTTKDTAAQQAVDNVIAEDALAGKRVADIVPPMAQEESSTSATAEANLEWVTGIGPKYNEVLAEHGIHTDEDLANATLEQLKATGITRESDEEFESWIQQAKDKLAGK